MSCEAKSEKLKACSKRVYESSVTSYEDEKFAPNFFFTRDFQIVTFWLEASGDRVNHKWTWEMNGKIPARQKFDLEREVYS